MKTTGSVCGGRTCTECGMHTGPGQPNCAALLDALLARDFEQPVLYWKYHRLTVDTYGVQHSPYVESAKSLAAHSCGLCVALASGNDPHKMKALQLWLSTNPKLPKPELPPFRGSRTIADVSGIEDPASYGQAVEAWAWIRMGRIWQLTTNCSGMARYVCWPQVSSIRDKIARC